MKILLVDDNESMIESLAIGLGRLGYTVDTAGNGIEAIKKLGNNNFDVLLTDLRMPEMDGMTLAKKVIENNSDLKIILMSAYGFPKNSNGLLKIEKPFEIEDLLALLNTSKVD